MDEITKVSEEAIIRYFTALSQFGYKSYNDVYKLLFLLFIDEVLTLNFSDFITEEEYRSLINASYCVFGNNCLISFPKFNSYDSLIHGVKPHLVPRITEDNMLRICESGKLRIE